MQENQYLDTLRYIKDNGNFKGDRTGTGIISVFRPPTIRFKLNGGLNYPLLTTKFTNFNAIRDELLWIISGTTNTKSLGSKIWNEWAIKETQYTESGRLVHKGDIGKMYGYVLRNDFYGNDPLHELIENIKTYPNSRRHVITTWKPEFLPNESLSPQQNVLIDRGSLANCHGTVIQFYINDGKISLEHYQRSADFALGVPFNIASYALLLLMVAELTGLEADELICDYGDAHIYSNHTDGIDEQLNRKIKNDFPSLEILNKGSYKTIDDFTKDSFKLVGYEPQERIKFPISI